MSTWKITNIGSAPKFRSPILIEGLPGIGNVGKVAADFLVDELGATKFLTISSQTFPHSVFVNENNLVEMPTIEMYYKKLKKNDLLLLVGDVQPIDEVSCYKFCDEMLRLTKEYGCKEIITIGGIGLQDIPKKPKIYCTGNSKKTIKRYMKGTELHNNLYGVVGPIIGVSGLLVGMAKSANINAICLLAETYGHPMYLGIKGAREILKVITRKLQLDISLSELDKEISEIEKGLLKSFELGSIAKTKALKKLKRDEEASYIG